MLGFDYRNPWPDDWIVAGTRIQLVPNDQGDLIAEKSEPTNGVVPTEYDLSSYPLYAERSYPLARMILGLGEKMELSGPPKRYYYGLFVDASIAGMVGKGPHFHSQDGVAGQPGRTSELALHGGVLTEFGAFGRYAYRRTSDAAGGWTLSKDFGAARTVTSLKRFKNRGGTVIDALYAALDNGELWQYDGASWLVTAGLPAGFLPSFLAVMDEDIFGFGGNVVYSATANPQVGANWTTPVFVGDASAVATGLTAVRNRIVAFKEDGPYGIDGSTGTLVVEPLMPELRNQRAATNGREATVWKDSVWFRHGDTIYQMDVGDGPPVIKPVGLSQLLENDSEVRGTPVAFAGQQRWFGYFAVVNGTDSYLCKWGSWENPLSREEASDADSRYHFSEVPHGALFKWTGKTATKMWVSPIAGAASNERLYVMFSDGSLDYCLLPKGSPNPYAAGSGCEFTLTPGQLFFTEVHCGFQAENKNWRGVAAFGPVLSATAYARHFYRTTPVAAWTEMDEQFEAHAQRIAFPTSLGSKSLRQYAQLENDTINESPVIEGWALYHSVVPEFILEYGAAADARAFRARRNGTVDTRHPDIIRQALRQAVSAIGAIQTTVTDGSVKYLNYFRYSEATPKKWTRLGLEAVIPFKAIEFTTVTVTGTHARMMQFSHGQLEAYSHSQLESL